MITIKKTLRFLIFLHTVNSLPVVAHIKEVLSIENSKKNHTLFFLSENHKRSRSISLAQSKQLLHFLRATEASLIAEDPSSLTNRTCSISTLYRKRRTIDTSVDYLTSLARHNGITATDIEFRSDTNRHRSNVSVDQLITETQAILQEIAEYDDGPIANQYYQEVITRHRTVVAPNCRRLLDRLKKKNNRLSLDVDLPPETRNNAALYGPIALFDNLEPKLKVRQALIDYNAELIDARLVHAIIAHQKKGKNRTIVCAGSWHLNNLYDPLARLGYRLSKHYPIIINNNPLELKTALQQLEPEYNPDAPLPKTMADLLLDYTEFEHEHPHLIIAIPAGILATLAGAIAYLVATIISSSNGVQQ